MPDIVIEDGAVHAAVGVARVAVCCPGRHQPRLHVQEELLDGADHEALEVGVGALSVTGVRVKIPTKNCEVCSGVADPTNKLLKIVKMI